MTEADVVAAAAANLLTAILCAAAAIWTRVTGEAVWVTVLLVILGLVGLVTAGLILRGACHRKFDAARRALTGRRTSPRR